MKTPIITKLHVPAIINAASHLKQKGQLAMSKNNLLYLDIDDTYIHKLFPLLHDYQVKMPDYFGEKSVGAHITAIYPEEGRDINKEDLSIEHNFSIKNLVFTEIGPKTYYILLVDSPSLLQLRRKYSLPDCKYAIWNEPVAQACPTCAWPILTIKITKKRGTELVCPHKPCTFSKPMDIKEAE